MKNNVGKKDIIVRFILGIVLVVLAFLYQWWILLPALVMFVTGYRKSCGLYSLFGISTCKLEDQK